MSFALDRDTAVGGADLAGTRFRARRIGDAPARRWAYTLFMVGDSSTRGPCPVDDGDTWFARAFDALYLDLYRHRDGREAAVFTRALQAKEVRGPFCEVACGPGRFLRALADAGETACGLDLSAPLLARAREVLSGGSLVRGDMRVLPFRGGAFGAVLLLFTSFGYFADPDDDRRVLAEAVRILRPDGSFVLDFLNAGATVRSLVAMSRREVAGVRVVERRWVDPRGPFLRKTVEAEPGEAGLPGLPRGERVRLYEPRELRALVAAHGLTVVAEFGDYEGTSFEAEESARFILVTRLEGTR
jgi:SAM-dependent methyltransferase